MVQAARSGYQNIGEGSEDSATSKKLEMNLTNVAKSSIGELARDYQKHLMRRKLRLWEPGDPLFEEARALRPETVKEAAEWVNASGKQQPAEERAANLGAILAAQAHWLTERLLNRQAQDFETGGGFSERLYKARTGGKNGRICLWQSEFVLDQQVVFVFKKTLKKTRHLTTFVLTRADL
jgi:four helix bundle suffix protein